MRGPRTPILSAGQATATFTFLGLALGIVPFLASGGWARGVAIVGIVMLSLCVIAVNRVALSGAFTAHAHFGQLAVPAGALVFLVALTVGVSVDLPGRVKAVRPSEAEVIEHFDIEGVEKTATRTLLRSYQCDIVQIQAYADLAGVRTEQAWTRKNYPGFTFISQGVARHERFLRPGNPWTDLIEIATADGHQKRLVFDISASFMATDRQRDYAQYFRDHRRKFCP